MNLLRILTVAAFSVVLVVGAARADDFVAECTKNDKTPGADKVCACAAGKLAGADRATALAAMKATNAAAASGKAEDAANAMAQHAKGMELVMTAEAACME